MTTAAPTTIAPETEPQYTQAPYTQTPHAHPQYAPTQAPNPAPAADAQRAGAFAVTSFVLGIVSIAAGWTFVAPVIGLVFGILALRRGARERALAIWGVWLNGAMLAFSALMLLIGAGALGVAIASGIFTGAW